MRTAIVLVCSVVILAGCSAAYPEPRPSGLPVTADTSVLVVDAEALVTETLQNYIDITNQIVSGADPTLIERVTTTDWAVEEINGFEALDALGGNAPRAGITQFDVVVVRGRHTLVDVSVAACVSGSFEPMRVSIHMVPRASTLVIAEIVPWEDSTWCAPLSLL